MDAYLLAVKDLRGLNIFREATSKSVYEALHCRHEGVSTGIGPPRVALVADETSAERKKIVAAMRRLLITGKPRVVAEKQM